MRQLFRAKEVVEDVRRARQAGGRGTALEGPRVQRAATHPVEVVVLPGGPERLEVPERLKVTVTRRGVPEAAHDPIEADGNGYGGSLSHVDTDPWRTLGRKHPLSEGVLGNALGAPTT
ncbi:hypothetical protein GCM10012286_32760 [Streptomyces lasiicapitis]|uniref:Uncharacterized protein n=1 Tax=Streptomyces lasiicapitis TaxID=1923961 RepID=A0ABQ2LZL7_9ACTN|nr:hypothetical protein GCM10012286_32760 [Streptomyces lasiicapitis]